MAKLTFFGKVTRRSAIFTFSGLSFWEKLLLMLVNCVRNAFYLVGQSSENLRLFLLIKGRPLVIFVLEVTVLVFGCGLVVVQYEDMMRIYFLFF